VRAPALAVAVAACTAIAAPALAQDEAPVVEPAPVEPPVVEPAPAEPALVAQQLAHPAAVRDTPGIDFAARVGYARPFGTSFSASAVNKLGDLASSAVPLALEAGVRANAGVTIGVLFEYAIMNVNGNPYVGCGPIVSCSGHVVHFGLEGIYNFNLDAVVTPWVGIGAGIEWFHISSSGNGRSTAVTANGAELLTLHAGGDVRISPRLAVGPYVSLTLASYKAASFGSPFFPDATRFDGDNGLHEWLQLGVRGRFSL
jgi:hypothetical protein